MDIATYEAEAKVEATHWWFKGRRRLFGREIGKLQLDPGASILDVGTSTGTNLRMLKSLGFRNVTGLDSSPEAIRYCAEKDLGTVQQGDICNLPFPDATFDLILATDIIEHVDEDATALLELSRALRPGGHILITVPAFQSLWGLQDDVSHHKRRYRKQSLNTAISIAGLTPQKSYYFNFVLFGPIWLARRLIRATRPNLKSENELNNPAINAVLTTIFEIDCRVAPLIHAPFGVSALTLAQRPASAS